jgi:hypothetical protein
MDALVRIDGKLDPFDNGRFIPSGHAAQDFEMVIAHALTKCESAREWLSAAAREKAGDDQAPAAVLKRLCRGRSMDRPDIIPNNAAACVR